MEEKYSNINFNILNPTEKENDDDFEKSDNSYFMSVIF